MAQPSKKFGDLEVHWGNGCKSDLISNILYYEVGGLLITHLEIFLGAQEINRFINLKFLSVSC